ncbi:hypothetical protein AAT19DRAFT_16132 [Rhodotorula toruloides]|uniref:Uncharacterized protein n=1 Tax=Rhodotorula toruloides TaxID=5286 RepID=A0A2T0A5T4_RHOTO|nr:hypothetical protein AAT19DRAFT_16132 [Rhodotorula toruloides]
MSSQQHPPIDASSPSTIPDDPSPHHASQPPSSSPSSANAPSNPSQAAQQPLGGAANGETSVANHPSSPSSDLPNGVSSASNPSLTASSQPNGERTPSSASSARPTAPSRSMSYKAEGDIWGSSRASNAFSGAGDDAAQRTTRAASDGAVLSTGFGGPGSLAFVPSGEPSRAAGGISSRLSSLGSEDSGSSNNDEQAFFRDYQRRSLEHSASQRLSTAKSFASPPLASARLGPGATSPFFQPPSFLSTTSATASGLTSSASNTPASSIPLPLLSPTSTSPPSSLAPPSVASSMMSATSNSVAGSPRMSESAAR